MLGKKPAILTGSFVILALTLLTLGLMGAYKIPEAGFDSTEARFNQYGRAFVHKVGQYDRNCDGRVDLIVADRNGDGIPDYWAIDRNFDGRFDEYHYDRNFDGKIDQWEYDTNNDGISDTIYVDSTGDGKADLYAVLNPVTRTYTWYGNMDPNLKTAKGYHPPAPITSKIQRQARGRKGDSM
jgi:hypothetical protein